MINSEHGQALIYNLFEKLRNNKRLAHAYLLEIGNTKEQEEIALGCIKILCCEEKISFSAMKECYRCTKCRRIEKEIFPEVKIIRPTGLWITKSQVLELQTDFRTKAFEGKKRIGVILECEKLNKHAANSLLKFLEEPESGVIIILISNNVHQVIPTIISRCQVINIKMPPAPSYQNIIDNGLKERIERVINFIWLLEQQKLRSLIDVKERLLNNIVSREFMITDFNIMLAFYKKVLDNHLGRVNSQFNEYLEIIEEVKMINDIMKLAKKITVINELRAVVENNANQDLLINKLIIAFAEE
ncbi:MAG: hypothetical protein ACOXZW_00625 [Bacilli bacterium]|jgi:DNA polymerase-3 subunit delta'|nr:hypothetical protein [Bacilli bacterium]